MLSYVYEYSGNASRGEACSSTKLAGQGGFVDYETIFRYFLQELKVVMPVI